MKEEFACLVIKNLITFNNFAALFNCTPVDWTLNSLMAPTQSFSSLSVMAGACRLRLVYLGSTDDLPLLQCFSGVV